MPECNLEKNIVRCTCTYDPCDGKRKCCERITYHWKMKHLPGCLFSPQGERTYDRSIHRFIAEQKWSPTG